MGQDVKRAFGPQVLTTNDIYFLHVKHSHVG